MWANQPIRDWIDAACRQYSRVMGRSLTFDAHLADGTPRRAHAAAGSGEQWRATICDGTQPVGTLRLRSRCGQGRDAEFLKACETAELAAQLIERAVTTRAAEEFGAWDPVRPRAIIGQARPSATEAASDEKNEPLSAAERIERLLDTLRRLTGFPAAALLVHDPESDKEPLVTIRTAGSVEIPAESLIRCHAALAGTHPADRITVLRRSAEPDGLLTFFPESEEIATGAVQRMGGPNTAQGTVWLFDRRDRRLTHRDRHVLGLVAARLQQLADRATLLGESSDNRELKVEIKVASRAQPSSPAHFVGRDGWCEIAGCMQSVRGIGGDLLELIPLANDRVFVAIGDAAGHSIPAALVMASVRGAVRALFDSSPHAEGQPTGRPPHEVVESVNSVLHSIVQSHQFMTMFCGILDGRTMTLEYANAGHPQPLLLRDQQMQRLTSHGLVLGVAEDATYERAVLPVRPGDVLTFYTDGITEAASKDRVLFGSQGIENLLLRDAGTSALEIRDSLWAAMQSHVVGSNRNDDRTLAVLCIAGSCAGGREVDHG